MKLPGKLLLSAILASIIALLGWDIAGRIPLLTEQAPVQADQDLSGPALRGKEKEQARTRAESRVILGRNIFGAVVQDRAARPSAQALQRLDPTPLRIALLGTVVGSSETGRAVIVDLDTKEQQLLREGDEIKGAILKKIHRRRVILRVRGVDQVLIMDEENHSGTTAEVVAEGPPQEEESLIGVEASEVTLDAETLVTALADIKEVQSELRFRTVSTDSHGQGILVEQVRAGSVIPLLGLRPGDIIVEMDSRPVSEDDEALAFFLDLRAGDSSGLVIDRQGQLQTIIYTIR